MAKPSGKGAGNGTKAQPWQLTTPPGTSSFEAYRDAEADPPALVVRVGKTELRYHERCIADLHAMLRAHGDWMALGGADEQKPAADDTVEAWGRAKTNPVKGWYGLKKGLRGRFGSTCRRCSRRSASPRSSTTRATTGCAPSTRSGDGAGLGRARAARYAC